METVAAKVKICGITNLEDARLAVELGADLLGFNFYPPSPRYIKPAEAEEIIATSPGKVAAVGVFVNESVETIIKVAAQCALQIVQLHGREGNEDCRAVAARGVDVMKAIRVQRPDDMDQVRTCPVEYVLLDVFREDLYGGTGHRFDWGWIRETPGKKVFLAGGITPANIKEALAVGTYGVDLCSGVEKTPGRKDPEKMRQLFAQVRGNHG
jgi:phosphoribosylanthranilate isomerase